jgi:SnoaL-like domain
MPTDLEQLLDRERVVDTVTRLFIATDQRDWDAVERCFADRVRFDMSSVGGADAVVTPREIASGWQQGLAPLQALHHQAGNFRVRVDDGRATAFCYGIAYHYRPRMTGSSTRVFVGTYDFELVRQDAAAEPDWRIDAMRFTLKFLDGNPALEMPE